MWEDGEGRREGAHGEGAEGAEGAERAERGPAGGEPGPEGQPAQGSPEVQHERLRVAGVAPGKT